MTTTPPPNFTLKTRLLVTWLLLTYSACCPRPGTSAQLDAHGTRRAGRTAPRQDAVLAVVSTGFPLEEDDGHKLLSSSGSPLVIYDDAEYDFVEVGGTRTNYESVAVGVDESRASRYDRVFMSVRHQLLMRLPRGARLLFIKQVFVMAKAVVEDYLAGPRNKRLYLRVFAPSTQGEWTVASPTRAEGGAKDEMEGHGGMMGELDEQDEGAVFAKGLESFRQSLLRRDDVKAALVKFGSSRFASAMIDRAPTPGDVLLSSVRLSLVDASFANYDVRGQFCNAQNLVFIFTQTAPFVVTGDVVDAVARRAFGQGSRFGPEGSLDRCPATIDVANDGKRFGVSHSKIVSRISPDMFFLAFPRDQGEEHASQVVEMCCHPAPRERHVYISRREIDPSEFPTLPRTIYESRWNESVVFNAHGISSVPLSCREFFSVNFGSVVDDSPDRRSSPPPSNGAVDAIAPLRMESNNSVNLFWTGVGGLAALLLVIMVRGFWLRRRNSREESSSGVVPNAVVREKGKVVPVNVRGDNASSTIKFTRLGEERAPPPLEADDDDEIEGESSSSVEMSTSLTARKVSSAELARVGMNYARRTIDAVTFERAWSAGVVVEVWGTPMTATSAVRLLSPVLCDGLTLTLIAEGRLGNDIEKSYWAGALKRDRDSFAMLELSLDPSARRLSVVFKVSPHPSQPRAREHDELFAMFKSVVVDVHYS